ncbi:dihydrofolate reductase family protein [Marinibaculum pumilum]|uniref:Dihydrofolate reductase family protein n=1 Tax=Marinibaculum pumilum TaxID=1766165 RepID=A0ABV7L0B7_9PROT
MAFGPESALFHRFVAEARGPVRQAFAATWRRQPKRVVSRFLTSVGPSATLVAGDLGDGVRALKAGYDGEIEIAGPDLDGPPGLINEYRIYLHPVALGRGKPRFTAPVPPLRPVSRERIGGAVVRLSCVPA